MLGCVPRGHPGQWLFAGPALGWPPVLTLLLSCSHPMKTFVPLSSPVPGGPVPVPAGLPQDKIWVLIPGGDPGGFRAPTPGALAAPSPTSRPIVEGPGGD